MKYFCWQPVQNICAKVKIIGEIRQDSKKMISTFWQILTIFLKTHLQRGD